MNTILLIEDNLDALDDLSEYLKIEGFKILAADTGKKGIELTNEFIPDLIICDVIMREMIGYTTYQELLKASEKHNIPLILSSTKINHSNNYSRAMVETKPYPTVKPVEIDYLITMAKKCLSHK